LNALFFVALLLYLIPAAFGLGRSPEHRRRFQLAAIVTLVFCHKQLNPTLVEV
jgi:hypothetical protein